jgi:hypothetical protein
MLLTRVKVNTTDATTGATVMLQPAQNTIVVQVLYALHDPIETEHALALAAAAGGVEEHVESFDSDRDFVVVLLCRCMCSFLRVKCEQLKVLGLVFSGIVFSQWLVGYRYVCVPGSRLPPVSFCRNMYLVCPAPPVCLPRTPGVFEQGVHVQL